MQIRIKTLCFSSLPPVAKKKNSTLSGRSSAKDRLYMYEQGKVSFPGYGTFKNEERKKCFLYFKNLKMAYRCPPPKKGILLQT